MKEQSKGTDNVNVGVMSGVSDIMKAKKVWKIRKYASKGDFDNDNSYDESEFEGNVLLNEGITVLQQLVAGTASPNAWNNANARLGVGDSTTAESAAHTGLQAATNKAYVGMEASYPQISGQTTTWRAVFDGDTANFSWQEFTLVNAATDSGDNLNRKVSNQGTKASGQIWTLSLSITWS
jgi:hypothetical protein